MMQNWVCEDWAQTTSLTERFPNRVARTPAGHDIEGKV